MIIHNEDEFVAFVHAKDIESAKDSIYTLTDCGAWMISDNGSILLGAIVEGCNFGTRTYRLHYPFSYKDYGDRIEAIEKEADKVREEICKSNISFGDSRQLTLIDIRTMVEFAKESLDNFDDCVKIIDALTEGTMIQVEP